MLSFFFFLYFLFFLFFFFFFNDTATTEIYTFPYTTLFRSRHGSRCGRDHDNWLLAAGSRSEEHTSELQSHSDLVCRLLLEKKKKIRKQKSKTTKTKTAKKTKTKKKPK